MSRSRLWYIYRHMRGALVTGGDTGPTNQAPSITSGASYSVAENSTAVGTMTATDPDAGTTLVWSITGGADAAKFSINSSTGALAFVSAPDYESPGSAAGTNVYTVQVTVSDGALSASKTLTITVTDVAEVTPSTGFVLDGDSMPAGTGLTTPSTDAYPGQLAGITGLTAFNTGVASEKLSTSDTEYATVVAPKYNAATCNTVVIHCGGNDLFFGSTATEVATSLQSYCAKARATGFRVAVCTITTNAALTGTAETQRQSFNTWLRANYASFADILLDVAARSELSDCTNETYFQTDHKHFNILGHNIFAEMIRTATGVTKETTAPTISTSAAQTIPENNAFSVVLAASEPVFWAITGGTDAAKFTLTTSPVQFGATLGMTAKDFETPTDADLNNTYVVQVTATDRAGNTAVRTITVTVTDVNENVTSWNPSDKSANISLTNGNLTATATVTSNYSSVRGTAPKSTGKWVFAFDPVTIGNANSWRFGLAPSSMALNLLVGQSGSGGIGFTSTGVSVINGTGGGSIASFTTTASEVMVAADFDAKLAWVRVGTGNWNNSGTANPATGTGGISFSALTGPFFPVMSFAINGDQAIANFGGTAFTGAIPSGFSAWG